MVFILIGIHCNYYADNTNEIILLPGPYDWDYLRMINSGNHELRERRGVYRDLKIVTPYNATLPAASIPDLSVVPLAITPSTDSVALPSTNTTVIESQSIASYSKVEDDDSITHIDTTSLNITVLPIRSPTIAP